MVHAARKGEWPRLLGREDDGRFLADFERLFPVRGGHHHFVAAPGVVFEKKRERDGTTGFDLGGVHLVAIRQSDGNSLRGEDFFRRGRLHRGSANEAHVGSEQGEKQKGVFHGGNSSMRHGGGVRRLVHFNIELEILRAGDWVAVFERGFPTPFA